MKKLFALLLCVCMLIAPAVLPVHAECAQNAAPCSWNCAFNFRNLFEAIFRNLNARVAKTEEKEIEQPTEQPVEQVETQEQSIERQIAELVNAERAKFGLPALTYSEELAAGARAKSVDMATNHYFAHESPTYGSPFDQMKARGITYRAAGENIAMGYLSAEAVMQAWMASPGHRANILSEKFTEIGVGYVAQGRYYTQWFKG